MQNSQTDVPQSANKGLIEAFKLRERLRNELPPEHVSFEGNPELRLLLSREMVLINRELRENSQVNIGQKFIDDYHLLVIVEGAPKLLDDPDFRDEFEFVMREGYRKGLIIFGDRGQIRELSKRGEPLARFYQRLAKICRSHETYNLAWDEDLEAILNRATHLERLAASFLANLATRAIPKLLSASDPKPIVEFDVSVLRKKLTRRAEEAALYHGNPFLDIDPREAELLNLTDRQVRALSDWDSMGAYLQECSDILKEWNGHTIVSDLIAMDRCSIYLSNKERRDMRIVRLLAEAQFQVRNWQSAAENLEFVVTLDSDERRLGINYALLGDIYFQMGLLDKAKDAYQKSYELGGKQPAAALKLANHLRILGDYDGAFHYLLEIEKGGLDKKRCATVTILAKTYESRFRQYGNLDDSIRACELLYHLLISGEYGNSTSMRLLIRMLDIPIAASYLERLIRDTQDEAIITDIIAFLGKEVDPPAEILQAIIQHIVHTSTPIKRARDLMKVVARFMARGYVSGIACGESFEKVATDVLTPILGCRPYLRRYLLLELFAAERGWILAEIIRRHLASALDRISPILKFFEIGGSEDIGKDLMTPLNSFLRSEAIQQIRPAAYSNSDSMVSWNELQEISDEWKAFYLALDNQVCSWKLTLTKGSVRVSQYSWLRARASIQKLLNLHEGPLAPVATECATWTLAIQGRSDSIHIRFSFADIPATRDPASMHQEMTRQLELWKQRLPNDLVSAKIADRKYSDTHVEISLAFIPTSGWPSEFSIFSRFVAFLNSESRAINAGEGLSPEYFDIADSYFPSQYSPPFTSTVRRWESFYIAVQDQQFALAIQAVQNIELQLTGVIHDLKRDAQILCGRYAMGLKIEPTDLEKIRQEVLLSFVRMNNYVATSLFQFSWPVMDAGAELRQIVMELQAEFPSIIFEIDISEQVYIRTQRAMFNSMTACLLHNAVNAILQTSGPQWLKSALRQAPSRGEEREQMWLTIINPYLPGQARSGESSGLGRKWAREFVEHLNGGSLTENIDPDNGVYEVNVFLPLNEPDEENESV